MQVFVAISLTACQYLSDSHAMGVKIESPWRYYLGLIFLYLFINVWLFSKLIFLLDWIVLAFGIIAN